VTPDRIARAGDDSRVVVASAGLLAEFNDSGVIEPLDVRAAQTIGRLLAEDDDRVLLAAALAVRGTRFGHVCIRLGTVREAVVVDGADPAEIEGLPWPDAGEWGAVVAASPLVGDGSGDEPLVLQDGRLYLERYFRYEELVARLILDRVGRDGGEAPLPVAAQEILAGELDERGAAPSRQHEAATVALRERIAVIAGGPGTGKTYTVATLLAALASGAGRFPLVALCAPTGKAAARLGQALGERAAALGIPQVTERLEQVEPQTIHRLLGWTWDRGRFRHDAVNRLPHDLVIVDEMSMVSLPMAAKLLAAVRDAATVVLVGDPDQLESIEAGTVLADIVAAAAGEAPLASRVVTLERGHRFGAESVIADFADAIRRADGDAAVGMLAAGGESLLWSVDRAHVAFRRLWESLVEQRSRMVTLAGEGNADGALAALSEMAVLCARRRGPDGVAGWSRDLEVALDERFTGLRWGGEWYPGRPVMITRNDYAQDLYNGDIGVCVNTGAGLEVVFDGGRRFAPSHLGDHTTVHAMTIHKSQGSQFDEVIVVLPDESSRLLTRELLYTAVTRARHRVRVVGTEEMVRQAIARSVQRASGLGPRLAGT
jgi:exodeoxyribonuclease V alpha subunit